MDDILAALDRTPDAVVTVRYGTEGFGAGLVALHIHGDGRAEVEQRQSGALTRDEARLTAERVATIGRQLADHRFTAPRTSTLPRQPGDTPLLLELRRADAVVVTTEIWYGDRFKSEDLDAIIRLADAVIHEVTRGRLGWVK